MEAIYNVTRRRQQVKRLLIYCCRFKHEWRVSTMFPRPPSASAAKQTGPTDDATETGSVSVSQKLMLSRSLLQAAAPGTFHLLPQTARAIEKLYRIIDREMHAIGAQKMTMPCLSSATPWHQSGRWDVMGSELFTLEDRKGSSYCLSPTHEEAVTSAVATDTPISYKRLPIMLYQIGRKFRDEMRPKNGLLRCREFEMKDLYTFDEDADKARASYEKVCGAYHKIFTRLGLNYVKVEADTGVMGGSLSHEFQLLADVGEDTLYTCRQCGKSFNKELIDETDPSTHKCEEAGCGPDFKTEAAIEVAHAFLLGTRYSSKFNATYFNKEQRKEPLFMGCFGIGVTRLLAAALEVTSLPDQIRWPRLLAPQQIMIVPQKEGFRCDLTNQLCTDLYDRLTALRHLESEVVLDDRLSLSIGRRLNEARQAGYPFIIIAGKQALDDPPLFEVIDVYSGQTEKLSIEEILCKAQEIETVSLW